MGARADASVHVTEGRCEAARGESCEEVEENDDGDDSGDDNDRGAILGELFRTGGAGAMP